MKHARRKIGPRISPALWFAAGILLNFYGFCQASPEGSGLDLISCMATTDERLAACDIRGFSIADPAVLEASLTRSHFELDSAIALTPMREGGFWGGLKHFSKFVYTGFRHYFVPKARAFLCMDQEDEYASPPSDTRRELAMVKAYPALTENEFQIDPSWAFTWARDDASDTHDRAWQRGHDRETVPLSLEPDLKTDHYGMSLDVRF